MEVMQKGNLVYGCYNRSWQVRCDGSDCGKQNAEAKLLPCGALLKVGIRELFNLHSGSDADKNSPSGEFAPAIRCKLCGSLTAVDLRKVGLSESEKLFIENRSEQDVENDPFLKENS